MRTTKAACGFDFGRYACHCCCEVSFCNKARSCSVVKRLWPQKVLDLSAAEYVPGTNDERPRMATQHSHEIPHCIKAEKLANHSCTDLLFAKALGRLTGVAHSANQSG